MEWPLKTGIIYIYIYTVYISLLIIIILMLISHFFRVTWVKTWQLKTGQWMTMSASDVLRAWQLPSWQPKSWLIVPWQPELLTRKTSWGCQFIYPVIYRVLKTSRWFGISEPSTVCYWKWLTSWRRHLAALAEAAWDWGVCDAGSYKTNNGNCAACPEGMTCPVGSEACRQVKSSLGLSKRPSLLSEWHFRS